MLGLQYAMVKSSRTAVFAYCKTFSPAAYLQPVDQFGHAGSVRNLQVHIANVYIHWMENLAQNGSLAYFDPVVMGGVDDVAECFEKVDEIVWRFIQRFNKRLDQPVAEITPGPGIKLTPTPLEIFTHVITHEFHHKGQIMTMGRILGYLPPDTDIIRF